MRKAEYARVSGKARTFINGQKYTSLWHPQNLNGPARQNPKLLLAANKRLNTTYLLKESFGQLWDHQSEASARKFFDSWRAQLKWQRLKPFEKFTAMIERHWDGIAAYCKPEKKSHSASSKGSTTRSASSSVALTDCRMRSTSGSGSHMHTAGDLTQSGLLFTHSFQRRPTLVVD